MKSAASIPYRPRLLRRVMPITTHGSVNPLIRAFFWLVDGRTAPETSLFTVKILKHQTSYM
jgi:hypothetical protein